MLLGWQFGGVMMNTFIQTHMKPDAVKIKLYFPEPSDAPKNNRELVDLLIKTMIEDESIKYTGYSDTKEFDEDMSRSIGNGDFHIYEPLSEEKRQSIENTIFETTKICHAVLPHPDLPIYIFVYPWFPNADDRILFKGTTAFAAYYTIHLFIDLNAYSHVSIEQTIAHEWNHLVFYRYHTEQGYSIRTCMVLEGLAEVFREEIVGGEPAPWSKALTNKESLEQLNILRGELDKKDKNIYREVFLDGKKYKRWTGYSIGYRLVKEFKKRNPELSWTELIKAKTEDIFRVVIK